MSNKKWFTDALLINRDPNWYGVLKDCSSAEMAESALRSFFEKFIGYSITDIQFCVFENTSIVPSQSVMWRGLKYLQTEENGIPVSYPQLEWLYRTYTEFGIDPVQIFLDTMRSGGIRPWLTLRMNDAHFGGDKTSFIRDDFYYIAQENGWMIGEKYGYFAYCLDYGVEQVRARMLSFISELLEKYDMFGLELDFMREIHCFDYLNNENRHAGMNDFIESVHRMCEQAADRFGHPVRLMVRMPAEIRDAYTFGFDVGLWAKNGWIDAVVPTPRWDVTDDGIPVAEWKELVGENIAVFPGVETQHLQQTLVTDEMAKAYSAAWNTQGADGLYFNNHDYATPWQCKVYGLHRDTVLEGVRRYIVTYQDIAAVGNPCRRPLPLSVESSASMTLCIGPIRRDDRLMVLVDFEGDMERMVLQGCDLGSGQKHAPVIRKYAHDSSLVQLTGEDTTRIFDASGIQTEGNIVLELEGHGTLKYLEFCIESDQ